MDKLDRLAERVGAVLAARGLTLAVAESCTGGLLAAAITSVAGSSRWFDRGFVCYSNAAKEELLGVSHRTLMNEGSVSEAAVRELALGVLERSQASLSVAVSGVAGPGGGSEQKPLGTVWFAWAARARRIRTLCARFEGDRTEIRCRSVATALEGLIDLAEGAGSSG